MKKVQSESYFKFDQYRIVNNEVPDEVKDIIEEYLAVSNKRLKNEAMRFFKLFLTNRIPNHINDFSDNTFYNDFYYCIDKLSFHAKNLVRLFYTFILESGLGNFENISTVSLSMHSGNNLLIDGYKIFKFNPFVDIPSANKWLLEKDNSIYTFDFSSVNHPLKQRYLKEFVWNYPGCSMAIKSSAMSKFIYTLNLVHFNEVNKLKINTSEIQDIKRFALNGLTGPSSHTVLSPVKTLIKYLDNCGYLDMLPMLLNMLKLTNVKSLGRTEAYTKDEIQLILKLTKEKGSSQQSDIEILYMLIYYLILLVANTSMRLATLIELKVNSIFESKPGSYYLLAPSKKVKFDKYNITKQTKMYLDNVIKLTNNYRTKSNSNYLFIHRKIHGQSIQPLMTQRVNFLLKNICIENNIRHLGLTGIRNKYMQDITKHVIDTGAGDSLLASLSMHSKQVHYTHYYESNEDVFLQLYGVSIGNLKLTGRVLKEYKKEDSSTVQNGCGVCSKDNCDNFTLLDCLMCKDFVTTPDNIPYFDSEILRVESEIVDQKIQHEKEFLISKKRLLVKFLSECKKLNNEEN